MRVLNQPMPNGALKYIVWSASLAKMPCWPLKQRSISSNLPVAGSYAANPLAVLSSGKFFAKALFEPVLQNAGCSARICELNQTRPLRSMCGWFGLTGSFQTISSPQYGDGTSTCCGDQVRSLPRSASTFIGTATMERVCFAGSSTASAPADQSGP